MYWLVIILNRLQRILVNDVMLVMTMMTMTTMMMVMMMVMLTWWPHRPLLLLPVSHPSSLSQAPLGKILVRYDDGNYNDDDCHNDDDHDGHNAKSYPESERSGKPPWFSRRGQHQPHTCICQRPLRRFLKSWWYNNDDDNYDDMINLTHVSASVLHKRLMMWWFLKWLCLWWHEKVRLACWWWRRCWLDDDDNKDWVDLLYNIMKHQLILFSHGHLTSKVSLT